MKQFTMELLDDQQRPVIVLDNGLTALLDTGAEMPVWVGDKDILVDILQAKSLHMRAPITGYGGTTYGEVYRVTLTVGELIFPNMLIVVNDELDCPFNMIFSATMFHSLIYEIDDKHYKLNVTIPDDEEFVRNVTLTDSRGNKIVLSQSDYL